MRTITEHDITAQCDIRGLGVVYAPLRQTELCTSGHGQPATVRVTVYAGPVLVATSPMCERCAATVQATIDADFERQESTHL